MKDTPILSIRFLSMLFLLCAPVAFAEERPETPWPAPVEGFAPVAPGEHPRLFFRRAELPALRARAETEEGRAILRRLRELLGGGEAMPEVYRDPALPFGDGTEPVHLPVGAYSFSHAAGFGLLYQLTEDPKYARLGMECFEWAFRGIRDRDPWGRYGWLERTGHLRAGPTLGWYAVAYDLLYDGLTPEERIRIARAIQEFDQGQGASLTRLAGGASHAPISNHWGMQVGGAALALLAIMDDPGVDMARLRPLLTQNQRAILRALQEGFGEGGFFAEGDGTGSMAAHIVLLPALQAWRTAGGQDFLSPRPTVSWMAKRWFFLANLDGGEPDFRPARGGYPHNVWARETLSGGGYFANAFGVLDEKYRPGLLWMYQRFLQEEDQKNGTPFDTVSVYPHTAVLAFINFPFDLTPKDPNGVWPNRLHDRHFDFYAWRNRYRDRKDVIVSVLGRTTRGYIRAGAEETIHILTDGVERTWGRFSRGIREHVDLREDGGSVLRFGDGGSFAVDFSRKSGMDVMLVMSGPGAPEEQRLSLGGVAVSFLFLGEGTVPDLRVTGDGIHAGEQRITLRDGRIHLRH